MPQRLLPVFQDGAVPITSDPGYVQQNGQVVYLHGMMPVFTHEVSDTASFKMIVSQFYINGVSRQVQIVNAFGINPLALKRWVKKYKQEGSKAAEPQPKSEDASIEESRIASCLKIGHKHTDF